MNRICVWAQSVAAKEQPRAHLIHGRCDDHRLSRIEREASFARHPSSQLFAYQRRTAAKLLERMGNAFDAGGPRILQRLTQLVGSVSGRIDNDAAIHHEYDPPRCAPRFTVLSTPSQMKQGDIQACRLS